MSQFVAELTEQLPDDAWLENVRLDDRGGAITALAPHASSAFSALTELRSVTAPAIVGAVSSESIGSERFERVTVHFRWRAADRRAANDTAARGRK